MIPRLDLCCDILPVGLDNDQKAQCIQLTCRQLAHLTLRAVRHSLNTQAQPAAIDATNEQSTRTAVPATVANNREHRRVIVSKTTQQNKAVRQPDEIRIEQQCFCRTQTTISVCSGPHQHKRFAEITTKRALDAPLKEALTHPVMPVYCRAQTLVLLPRPAARVHSATTQVPTVRPTRYKIKN